MADMAVANEISRQIGKGSLFMIGAKNLVGDDSSLTFKIMRNVKKVTHVKIELDPSDTYTVRFIKVARAPRDYPVELHSVPMVYFDQLKSVISDGTGLALEL